jgi:hypothetical protein
MDTYKKKFPAIMYLYDECKNLALEQVAEMRRFRIKFLAREVIGC